MVIVAGFILFLFLGAGVWLIFTIDDWSRDLTTNYATTSSAAKNPSLRPIEAELPPAELAKLTIAAAREIPGWQFKSQQDSSDEIRLHFVRTTKLMRFKDDITVRIRPVSGEGRQPRCEISAESQSRLGKGDLGQNPRNLRELMDKLRIVLQ